MKLELLQRRVGRAAAAATAVLAVTQGAAAVPLYWDGTGTGWDSATSWSTDPANGPATDPAAPPGAADVATFNITGLTTTQTVSLNADQAALGLSVVSTGTVTLQGGGTNRTLSLGAGGITTSNSPLATVLNVGSATANQNVNVSLVADQTWAHNGGNVANQGIFVRNAVSSGTSGARTLTLAGSSGSTGVSAIVGAISDGGVDRVVSLTMNPSSSNNRWNLNGNNTYTGATTITLGAVGLNNANALGNTAVGTTVASGAALFLRSGLTYAAEPLAIAGIGPTGSTAGAFRNVSGTSTWTGDIAVDATTTTARLGADGGGVTINGAVTVTGANTLDVVGAGDVIINGALTGAVPVTRSSGIGALALTGTNKLYAGTTTITGGSLVVNTGLTNSTGVVIGAAGTLRGNGGSIATAATTTINGTIAPGAAAVFTTPAIGSLSMGPLTLTSTGTFALDVNSTASTTDLVTVTGNLTLDAGNATTLTANDLGSTVLTPGTQLTFIDYSGTWNGGVFRVGGTPLADDTGFIAAGVNGFYINYNGGPSGNDVILTAVPEPASLGVLGFATLGLLLRRRRAS